MTSFEIPIRLMILCSVVMALGTSIGGYRIIKAVGMDMVHLKGISGFSADVSATTCLLISFPYRAPGQYDAHENHCHHGRRRHGAFPPFTGAL